MGTKDLAVANIPPIEKLFTGLSNYFDFFIYEPPSYPEFLNDFGSFAGRPPASRSLETITFQAFAMSIPLAGCALVTIVLARISARSASAIANKNGISTLYSSPSEAALL